MKPVIGIPLRYQKLEDDRPITYMSERLRRTIQQAGGIVYPIAPVQDVDYIYTRGNEFDELTEEEKYIINYNLNMCDGVIFPGGIKFTPYDRYLLELIIEKKIPVLGICLGMQMMSCYNEEVILENNETLINHNQNDDNLLTHKVLINKNSKLYQIIGKEEIMVNSFHNKHVSDNNIYETTVLSEDGIIEGIEYSTDTFNIGVQWHPEISYEFDDSSKNIIDAFINSAKKYNENKQNHESVFVEQE